nr:signal peptidase I [Halobacillus massiliensis]
MFKFFQKALSLAGCLLVICLAVLVIAVKASGGEPTILNHQFKSVLSGSMEPEFSTGSIISVKLTEDPTGYQKGDVITFIDKDENIVTHRVTEVEQTKQDTIYRTKGDNNDGVDLDPVLSENVIGHYTGFAIPYAGYLLSYAGSKLGSALLLFIPGLILFTSALFTFRGVARDLKSQEKAA